MNWTCNLLAKDLDMRMHTVTDPVCQLKAQTARNVTDSHKNSNASESGNGNGTGTGSESVAEGEAADRVKSVARLSATVAARMSDSGHCHPFATDTAHHVQFVDKIEL